MIPYSDTYWFQIILFLNLIGSQLYLILARVPDIVHV